jgi:4-amino-4-deoxy-L-arabinose transferase-like glycosyltransferase
MSISTYLGGWRAVALILGLCAALRLIWALTVPVVPISDSAMYHQFALSIVSGAGYAYPDGSLTAYWPVGTSALYALIYFVFGTSTTPVVVLNLLLGLIFTAQTICLSRVWFSERVALAAGVCMAVWPMLIQLTTVLASELPCAVFTMAGIITYCKPPKTRKKIFLAGIYIGIACYFRPTIMILLILLPVLEALVDRATRMPALRSVLLISGFALVVLPWSIRNHDVFGQPALISTNFGANLWMGNNPESQGHYMSPDMGRYSKNEVLRDRQLRAEAIRNIRSDPFHYLVQMSWKRFVVTHARESIGVAWNQGGLKQRGLDRFIFPLKLASSAYWWVMILAAFVGLQWGFRDRSIGILHPLVVITGVLIAIPTLTVGQDRYHFSIIPFVAIFAGLALQRLMDPLNKVP